MNTMKMARCPICGKPHPISYYDPYNGRLGPGTGFYSIKCKKYERPIEISCFSLGLLEKATEEVSKWKSTDTSGQSQAES